MTIDLRRYKSQTLTRLIVWGVVLLIVVGGGLIWWLYGFGAAVTGLLCIFSMFIPLGLIWLFMIGLDWLVKKLNEE